MEGWRVIEDPAVGRQQLVLINWDRPTWPGLLHPYGPERFELIQRLKTRWRDGKDPGLPARVKQAMRRR